VGAKACGQILGAIRLELRSVFFFQIVQSLLFVAILSRVVLLLHLHFLLVGQPLGQAEVTQTRVLVVVQEHVLRFYVSMQNIALVQVIDGF